MGEWLIHCTSKTSIRVSILELCRDQVANASNSEKSGTVEVRCPGLGAKRVAPRYRLPMHSTDDSAPQSTWIRRSQTVRGLTATGSKMETKKHFHHLGEPIGANSLSSATTWTRSARVSRPRRFDGSQTRKDSMDQHEFAGVEIRPQGVLPPSRVRAGASSLMNQLAKSLRFFRRRIPSQRGEAQPFDLLGFGVATGRQFFEERATIHTQSVLRQIAIHHQESLRDAALEVD